MRKPPAEAAPASVRVTTAPSRRAADAPLAVDGRRNGRRSPEGRARGRRDLEPRLPDDRARARCRTASRSSTPAARPSRSIRVAVEFDAGIAADPADALGTQSLMLSLLDEGTTSRNSIQIAEEQERLGAVDRRRRVARPDRGQPVGADPQSRRRRSTCSPTSSATRPSPRPRSSGCGPAARRDRAAS